VLKIDYKTPPTRRIYVSQLVSLFNWKLGAIALLFSQNSFKIHATRHNS